MTTTATLTLTDFLLARIAEDEAVALAAIQSEWHFGGGNLGGNPDGYDALFSGVWAETGGFNGEVPVVASVGEFGDGYRNEAHIARHDPARVLAECEAKRALIATLPPSSATMHNGPPMLRLLAAIYADHPDYRAEWRP